jgi:short subunit dehydrogenase-like uncharacterized protein
MIYGANGYQGSLIAQEARRRGLTPILAGRHAAPIARLGAELGCETRVFGLANPAAVERGLAGVATVLHCAGPFSATSQPMLAACLRTRTNYLDITGEIGVFEPIFARAAAIAAAGIVALPGVGFDVVPSDCLAALLHSLLPDATRLTLAFATRHGKLSPGTTKTALEGLAAGAQVRTHGSIVPTAPATREIPFTDRTQTAMRLSWGDVSTAFHSTGIPNIEVYLGATPAQARQLQPPRLLRALLGLPPVRTLAQTMVGRTVKGPDEAQRGRGEMQLWGEVSNDAGQRVALHMRTPDGYSFTTESALACVTQLGARELAPGVYTPSRAFGPEFALSLPGVTSDYSAGTT